MKVLRLYYLKEFARAYAVIVFGLSLMLASVELVDRLEKLTAAGFADVMVFLALLMPQYVVYTMPIAGLFAGLFVTGQAIRSRETVAVMTAGGRMKRLFLPLLAAGLLLAPLGFSVGELLVPSSLLKAKSMTAEVSRSLFKSGTVWLRAEDGSLVRFNLYLKDERAGKAVSVFRMEGGRLSARIEAGAARYTGEAWVLEDAVIYDFTEHSVTKSRRLALPGGFIEPELIEKGAKSPEEMGLMELREYTRRLEEAGIRNAKLSVDLHSKLSYPLVNFFMVLLAVSLSLRSGLGGFAAVSLGVAVSLAYWFGYTISLSLGYAGILPPFAAAWAAPLAFAALSVWLFRGIKE